MSALAERMTDPELVSYIESHARTELGQTHRDHVARLLELAGHTTDHLAREWYYLDSEDVAPLIAKAREFMGIVVRNLAERWVWSQMTDEEKCDRVREYAKEHGITLHAPIGMFGWGPANPGTIADDERERLFAWVRATLPTSYGRTQLRKTQALAAKLGVGDRKSWDLCEASGCWS